MERDKLDFGNGKIKSLFTAMFFPTLIGMVFNSVLNICDGMFVGHGVGKELHEDPEVPNFGNAGRGPRLVPGMCIAVEPMVCQYKYAVKTLKDGWTVKTCDGGLAAHFEHTMAITTAGAEVLTHGWEEPGWTL